MSEKNRPPTIFLNKFAKTDRLSMNVGRNDRCSFNNKLKAGGRHDMPRPSPPPWAPKCLARPSRQQHSSRFSQPTRYDTAFKVKRSKIKITRPIWLAVLAGQHGHRVSNGSTCVYDVYRVTTCRPGRGHIMAASRLQLVDVCLRNTFWNDSLFLFMSDFCCGALR